METALKILSDEHQNILKAINLLLNECGSLQLGKEIDKGFFGKAIDFVRGYADRFHHVKEEDILFKEFDKCAEEGSVRCNPVGQMLHEHDLGRKFIKELEIGIEENNRDKIIENVRAYAQLLQEHIFKEDNILYPMADEALSQNIKDGIAEKFRQVEQRLAKEKEKHLLFLKELN